MVKVTTPSLDHLAERAARLSGTPRTIIGIVGAPGSGKSSLARKLVNRLNAHGTPAVCVPMDGFHMADAALRERGILDRKGAPETFDAHGYMALLQRIRHEVTHDVLAPAFERTLEQPIAGAITVSPDVRVVVTEGNYLLDLQEPWPQIGAMLDEVWLVDLDHHRRRARLVDRHVKFGKSREAAQAWMDHVDEPNAQRVLAQRHRATLVIKK
jgi:pantothenate kinase